MINRRDMLKMTGSAVALASLSNLPRLARAARPNELNILCWEGYNTSDVLDPFRREHPGAKVNAESGTSDPDMINKLRAGEVNVWDLINLNQPWAREQMYPAGLIKPLDRGRFEPFFDKMMKEFQGPYEFALDKTALLPSGIQGESISYAVTLESQDGFSQLAALEVTGLPADITAEFDPPQIAEGQTALLTLTAPLNQAMETTNLTVMASASVDGMDIQKEATASLTVQAVTTSF